MKNGLIYSITHAFFIAFLLQGCTMRMYSEITSPEKSSDSVDALVAEIVKPLCEGGINSRIPYPSAAVGIVTPTGESFFSFVSDKYPGIALPIPNTIFEIGSVSKVITSLLFATEIVRGAVSVDTPAQKVLNDFHIPSWNGDNITLLHLSTHTSGLPRVPNNLNSSDPMNPYANYDVEQLKAFLTNYKLKGSPGSNWDYSNTGAGLLGYALTRTAGVESYHQLLQQRIAAPLGLVDTGVNLSEEQLKRLAPAYFNGEPTSWWDLNVLVGLGGIRSTVKDMTLFLKAELNISTNDIGSAISLTQRVGRKPQSATDGHTMGLGWIVNETPQGNIFWHNGATFGAQSFVAINPQNGIGVVLLTNGMFTDKSGAVDNRTDVAGMSLLKKLMSLTSRNL
jgi:CubicO group peptidase (beta-lactamase class C family)